MTVPTKTIFPYHLHDVKSDDSAFAVEQIRDKQGRVGFYLEETDGELTIKLGRITEQAQHNRLYYLYGKDDGSTSSAREIATVLGAFTVIGLIIELIVASYKKEFKESGTTPRLGNLSAKDRAALVDLRTAVAGNVLTTKDLDDLIKDRILFKRSIKGGGKPIKLVIGDKTYNITTRLQGDGAVVSIGEAGKATTEFTYTKKETADSIKWFGGLSRSTEDEVPGHDAIEKQHAILRRPQ